MVDRVNGRALTTVESPRRAGDPPTLVARAQRVREVLGWAPHYDDLEEIVRSQLALGAPAAAGTGAAEELRDSDRRSTWSRTLIGVLIPERA